MLWIDIATPKYAIFFAKMIPFLEKLKYKILVTTRYSSHYDEAKKVLDLHNIRYEIVGNYGGLNKKDKFIARLDRQRDFINIFNEIGYPKALICGGVVDSVQTAYGLGIKVINIYDTPMADCKFNMKALTATGKLTIPFSDLMFYPFVLPKEIFLRLGLEESQLNPYGFIDVCLWMKDIEKKETNDFRKKYNLDTSKPTILIREEEYKAHYVKEKLPIIYNLIPKLSKEIDANLVIMPRYENDYLKKDFSKYAFILEDKLKPNEFYPFIDLLLGAGGTMNLEASYYGIPVISTRSLWLYHDKYLIDNDLMKWTDSEDKAIEYVKELLGKKFDNKKFFCKDECNFDKIINKIVNYLKECEI